MLITRPQPRSTIPSQTCLVMLKQLSRLVLITASQLALSIFLNVVSRVMPALFTSTSIGPTLLDDLRNGRGARLEIGDVAGIGVEVLAMLLHRVEPIPRPWCLPGECVVTTGVAERRER